jgi:hypothetical protein
MGRGAIVGVTPTVDVRVIHPRWAFSAERFKLGVTPTVVVPPRRGNYDAPIYKDAITDSPGVVVAPTVGVTYENGVELRLVIVVGVRETFSS